MFVEVIRALGARAEVWSSHPPLHASGTPTVALASLSIPDTLFLFVVALVVFGPKRLPEIGKQIGKLVFEFRRASNDFKLQIEEELRLSEQQERQKTLEMQAAAAAKAAPAAALSAGEAAATLAAVDAAASMPEAKTDGGIVVQPPASGAPVEGRAPNRVTTEAGLEHEPVPPARERVPESRPESRLENRPESRFDTNGIGGSTQEMREAIARGTTVVADEPAAAGATADGTGLESTAVENTAAAESTATRHG